MRSAIPTVALLCAVATAAPLSLLQARSAHLARLQATPPGWSLPPDETFNATTDNLNVLGSVAATWQQRFWTNATFYQGKGPLFMYIEVRVRASRIRGAE